MSQPLDGRLVAQHEFESRVLAGEGVDLDVRVDAQTQQIAVTVMHGDQREARHQEREGEAEIAVVVESGDQHRDEQRASMIPKRVGRM